MYTIKKDKRQGGQNTEKEMVFGHDIRWCYSEHVALAWKKIGILGF